MFKQKKRPRFDLIEKERPLTLHSATKVAKTTGTWKTQSEQKPYTSRGEHLVTIAHNYNGDNFAFPLTQSLKETSVSQRELRRSKAHALLSSTLSSPITRLNIPSSYKYLIDVFNALESVLALYQSRKKDIIIFEQARKDAERICHKNITELQLSQILFIFPLAYDITRVENIHDNGRTYNQLALSFNLSRSSSNTTIRSSEIQMKWLKLVAKNLSIPISSSSYKTSTFFSNLYYPKFTTINNSFLAQRKHLFEDLIISLVYDAHELFLSSLSPRPPLSTDISTMRAWHIKFPFKQLPTIPYISLPLPPDSKSSSSSSSCSTVIVASDHSQAIHSLLVKHDSSVLNLERDVSTVLEDMKKEKDKGQNHINNMKYLKNDFVQAIRNVIDKPLPDDLSHINPDLLQRARIREKIKMNKIHHHQIPSSQQTTTEDKKIIHSYDDDHSCNFDVLYSTFTHIRFFFNSRNPRLNISHWDTLCKRLSLNHKTSPRPTFGQMNKRLHALVDMCSSVCASVIIRGKEHFRFFDTAFNLTSRDFKKLLENIYINNVKK